MPLPLIIGAIAGAATTLGVGAGIYGASKIKEAKVHFGYTARF